MDVAGIFSLFTNGLSAYKAAVETLDEAKIVSATNELTAQLAHLGAHVLSMQEKASQSAEREAEALTLVRELKEKVQEFERRRTERERYELVEPHPGTFVLCVKEHALNGEPSHYLCPGCLDNQGLKSILQFRGKEKRYADCTSCRFMYQLKDDEPYELETRSGGWMG